MFEGFESFRVDVGDTAIFVRRKGAGRPLLLLHGFPQTHLMWHRVAPTLAQNFHVVCADLRGYGSSDAPASQPDHFPYSKRAMGDDMLQMMRALGFERFSVAGHDRGARVAYRTLSHWGSLPSSFPPEVRRAYVDAIRNPHSVHAICEEYRAAAGIDIEIDRADRRAGRRITGPLLVLWARGSGLDSWYANSGGPIEIWRRWASDVSGRSLAGGHFFPEENAIETTTELQQFFSAPAR